MYRELPRQSVHAGECHISYTPTKDHLTGVLIVYVDVWKVSLNIISQFKTYLSFPRSLNPTGDFEIFYKAED